MKKFIDLLHLLGVDALLLGLLERLLGGLIKKLEAFKQTLCSLLDRLALYKNETSA